ncbi:unnamed protein product [Adineta steineri]|uniref:MACPF domain-containing protein n=1 Tax=Adineta steineri TaxID=433720 RepID=A0A818PBQ1_9BILA|nr:unnamed protein product [Adineta steineri]CAF3621742.1 unnamed protein product [Adineta steineri]
MTLPLSLLFFTLSTTFITAFICPTTNNTYPHEWNNAAYYQCSKDCAYQRDCPPKTYYSSSTRKCISEPADWSPQFDLTGQYIWSDKTFMEIRQVGYDVQWSTESNDAIYNFVGRYLNATMVSGLEIILEKTTNCVSLQEFDLSVTGKRNFCRSRVSYHCILSSLIINIYCINQLPGINDISAGYDAAKMLSANEQNSKYRIFDLSEQSTTSFNIKILGKDQKFAVPKFVQVTDVSIRKEDTCQTIAYTFESFFHSYFQSTSFGIGIGIPGVINVAVGYRETLKQIQEAITKSEKAVGISTIWWGLYSVQLGPPLFLKLDPMFTQSIDLLASEASNPTSEDHQLYYNQFIETYGTHYVSRIIVGGTAYLYTLLDSNYHKEYSYEETSSQVSLMFEYKQYNGQYGQDATNIWSQIKETFKKNAVTTSIFQPPVAPRENKSDWEVWQQTAGDQPVAVNRTLFSIHDLIKNKTTVREHLRKTIEFYLKKGFMPTLAELNNRNTFRLVSIPSKPIGPINGLDVVGCGYDILLMENRYCIFDQSNFTENETWSDPYDKQLTYSIPNGWFVVNTPESLTFDGSILITSVEDYFRWTRTVTVTKEGGFLGLGQKRRQKTITEFYRRFYQDYYNLDLHMKQIGWYTLSVSAFPYPKLNSVAQSAIDRLPTRFDIKDLQIWQDFFNIFGTHVVVSSNFGGQVWAETWYEKCLTYEHTQQWIDEQLDENWLIFTYDVKHREDHTQTVDQRFTNYSISSSQLLGGTESIPPSKWEEWIPTIKTEPRPISYRLISLDEILPESDRRNALKEAIHYILTVAKEEDQSYIDQLETIREPPRKNCTRNEIRTRRQTLTNDRREEKQDLCPYVGYNGKECLGSRITGRSLPAENATKLPVGIGMTLDITTGTLLLPALEYTYLGNNYWTDPITSIMYQAPRGITFPGIKTTDNDPVSRVFLTAAELSNEWKYEKLKGSWLGGEFGHSKSLLDLYKKFFSMNQGIAIVQKPTVLYRLRVENLQLNKYAKAAIQKLPVKYDETLYSDFLQNWGTHIVQQSLVGGMHEQQVLFKDCVFSFNGAITSDNLNDYLKQDILSETLGNSFYADRRKISVDHWIGGNPTEKNQTRWLETLADNPALIKIEEYVPWSDVIEIDRDVRENLKKIIQSRTTAADKKRIDEEDQVTKQRINGSYMARDGSIGLLNNGKCDIKPATFGSVEACSKGCPTNVLINGSADFLGNQQLWYLRDETTGFIRAQARINSQTVREGPSVNAGCSSIDINKTPTTSAHICVACDLVSSFSDQCVCVCPTYPPSSVK